MPSQAHLQFNNGLVVRDANPALVSHRQSALLCRSGAAATGKAMSVCGGGPRNKAGRH